MLWTTWSRFDWHLDFKPDLSLVPPFAFNQVAGVIIFMTALRTLERVLREPAVQELMQAQLLAFGTAYIRRLRYGLPRFPRSPIYKIATAFGGLATPPGTFNGTLLTKKLHRPSSRHFSASFSR